MRALRRAAGALVAGAVALAVGLLLVAGLRGTLTPLDLGEPIGAGTGRQLTALHGHLGQCEALLRRAGVHFERLAPVTTPHCAYADALRFTAGGSRTIGYQPAGVALACPVAAALAMWEWDVIQPAALRRFGQPVARIEHLGSYNCRRIYGRGAGPWSEHASADAIDVAGFRLADGRRITVAHDWRGDMDAATFLHDVRAGGCRLFATVLSPDYNAAHHDHLHLDQAQRVMGGRACR